MKIKNIICKSILIWIIAMCFSLVFIGCAPSGSYKNDDYVMNFRNDGTLSYSNGNFSLDGTWYKVDSDTIHITVKVFGIGIDGEVEVSNFGNTLTMPNGNVFEKRK